jgi:pimeloyl-ACP methyl ester carboxylesterase
MGAGWERSMILPGSAGQNGTDWQPFLLLREQTLAEADRSRPVVYVHGATFPSALSMMFRFDGISWADVLAEAGFSVWAFDFAGFGGSQAYPDPAPADAAEGPLGRVREAARQVARVVAAVRAETGAKRVSLIAHSWGTMAAGRFAADHPDEVDRLVMFGPIARRQTMIDGVDHDPWRLVTIDEQYRRFVADVPAGEPPVLLDRHFRPWARAYLASDPQSGRREPPAVRIPNGPSADIRRAWAGELGYDPAAIRTPTAILRGEWDSLTTDADAASLLAGLSGAGETRDVKLARGTHLMHLEESRHALYRAAIGFLKGSGSSP